MVIGDNCNTLRRRSFSFSLETVVCREWTPVAVMCLEDYFWVMVVQESCSLRLRRAADQTNAQSRKYYRSSLA